MANFAGQDLNNTPSGGRRDRARPATSGRARARRVAVGALAALSLALSGTALAAGTVGISFQTNGKSWASSGPVSVHLGPIEAPMGKYWAAADPTPPVTR